MFPRSHQVSAVPSHALARARTPVDSRFLSSPTASTRSVRVSTVVHAALYLCVLPGQHQHYRRRDENEQSIQITNTYVCTRMYVRTHTSAFHLRSRARSKYAEYAALSANRRILIERLARTVVPATTTRKDVLHPRLKTNRK